LLLSGIWIYAIAVVKCKHPLIVRNLVESKQPLTVNLRGIEPLKLTWGIPCISHHNL
jgi:hypothetical protein